MYVRHPLCRWVAVGHPRPSFSTGFRPVGFQLLLPSRPRGNWEGICDNHWRIRTMLDAFPLPCVCSSYFNPRCNCWQCWLCSMNERIRQVGHRSMEDGRTSSDLLLRWTLKPTARYNTHSPTPMASILKADRCRLMGRQPVSLAIFFTYAIVEALRQHKRLHERQGTEKRKEIYGKIKEKPVDGITEGIPTARRIGDAFYFHLLCSYAFLLISFALCRTSAA